MTTASSKMATSDPIHSEEYIEVPASLFNKRHGVSIDFGSSQMKIAYVTPSQSSDKLRVNLVTYSRERYDDGLQFLSEVYQDHLQPDELVNVTGINCDVDHVQSKLNIRSQIILESECLLDGFQFLVKSFPLHEVTYSCPDEVNEFAHRVGGHMTHNIDVLGAASGGKIMSNQRKEKDPEGLPLGTGNGTETDEVIQYPAMVCLLGSTYQMCKINADGTAQYFHVFPVSGRTVLGLGSLLAQSKSFDELIELAQNGSANNCDTRVIDLLGHGEDGEYSDIQGDFTVFSFGRAVGKTPGEMSREDLAASCVSLVAHSIGFFAHMTAVAHGARQVFFCGGLTSHQYTRDYIWKIFNYRNVSNQQNYEANGLFLKYGSFLAVIGCLMKNLQAK